MTIQNEELKILADLIELSPVGLDNALTENESNDLAKVVLKRYLIVEKDRLPEAKHMDTMIYAGSQAVNANSNPEDVLDKALSYLAAAAKLTELQEEAKAEQEKEKKELLDIINEFTRTSPNNRATYASMTNTEILAAQEIKKLRLELEAGRSVKVVHGGFAVND